MEKTLEIEFKDLFGGDGFTRPIKVSSEKLKRETTDTINEEEINFAIKKKKKQTKTETRDDVVQTFQRDENGDIVFRLGGIHGKMWGATRAAGKLLGELKNNPEINSKASVDRIMTMVSFEPVLVKLENISNIQEVKLPQLVNNMGRQNMIFPTYDVIKNCTCKINIQYPDIIEGKVIAMLEQAQRMATMNKRRATMKITNWNHIVK